MCSATRQQDALNRCAAAETRLAGAQVDAVLELKKTFDAVCVHIVGHRGATELDGMLQHFSKSQPQPFQFDSG